MLLLVVVIAGCVPVEPLPIVQPTASPTVIGPVVLGAILDMADDSGKQGRQQFAAATLAVELVNRRGGLRLPSGERRALELRVYDDAGRPDRAELSVQRLADDGAVAIVGPSLPDSVSVARQAAEAQRVPLIALEHPSMQAGPGWHWTFALAAPAEEPLAAVIDFFAASGVDRFAWMAPRSAAAAGLGRAVRRMATGAGMRVVGEEIYAPGETAHIERLARLQAADPRVILAWVRDPDEAATVATQAKEVPELVPVFFGPAASAPSMLERAGEAGTGTRTVTLRLPVADDLWDHDPLTPGIRDFGREMRSSTGREPTAEAAAAWDAVRIIVAALERVGTERDALRNAIESTTVYLGASGSLTFGPDRHDALDRQAFIVARGESGRWRLPP